MYDEKVTTRAFKLARPIKRKLVDLDVPWTLHKKLIGHCGRSWELTSAHHNATS